MKSVDKNLAMEMGKNQLSPMVEGSGQDAQPMYPSFHYEGPEEIKIPAHGNMTVHYCVTRVRQTTTNSGEWYECDIQIKRIISAEEEKDDSPTKKNDDTENALDKLARERMDEDEGEE